MKKELLILLFVVLPMSMQAQCELLYVSTATLNIRETPNKLAKIRSKVSFQQSVMVESSTQKDGFVMVKSNNCVDTLGYIWAGYLVKEMPEEAPQQPTNETYSTTRTKSKKTSSSSRASNNSDCGPAGVTIQRGPKGGCFYYSGKTKIYVGRGCCN